MTAGHELAATLDPQGVPSAPSTEAHAGGPSRPPRVAFAHDTVTNPKARGVWRVAPARAKT